MTLFVDGEPEDFHMLVVDIQEVVDDLRRWRHRTRLDSQIRTNLESNAHRLRRFADYMEHVANLPHDGRPVPRTP